MDTPVLFLLLLPIVAFLYSAVGHGGASGYLALMSFWSFPVAVMKPTALTLNLFVSALAFIAYARKRHFRWSLFLAFAIGSVPMAYIGGRMVVDVRIYRMILAVFLIFAVLRLMGWLGRTSPSSRPHGWVFPIVLGALIGLFSGIIGIGGGVILSPLIILIGWGNVKEAAAVSAAFIWVNSAAALIGYHQVGDWLGSETWLLVGLAFFGGLAGAYLGSTRFETQSLKRMLALVLFIASLKLFFS